MNLQQKSHSGEDGFTFIEVIAAIAIISLSSFVIWAGVRGGVNALERVYTRSKTTVELARLEYMFRRSVNEISTPYWESEIDIQDFDIYQEGDILILESGGQRSLFRSLVLQDYQSDEKGIAITLISAVGQKIELFECYGSFVLEGDL